MNKLFYPKLALSNIGKNKKIYFPYIFTCIFTIMMYYIMSSIINNTTMKQMYGGVQAKILLSIAIVVVEIFAVIFLFYTNSFLMKRRKKEIGLYNILGMEKRHIGIVISFETLYIVVISIVSGLLLGIILSKFMMMLLIRLMGFTITLQFQTPIQAVINTVVLFTVIFIITLIYNLAQIRLTNPIQLLHGGEIGEKEPKTKLIMTIIGLACISAGYGFALTVDAPLQAVNLFFGAVILVVIGTYALFTAGSITILKLMRRNKKYYYKTSHFTNVSGMLYRMKQNAVGLASICILSTMVLILFSTTVSLYSGMEETLDWNYPNDISVTAEMSGEDKSEEIQNTIEQIARANNVEMVNGSQLHSISTFCKTDGNKFDLIGKDVLYQMQTENTAVCIFYQIDEFNKMNNTDYQLGDNEVIIYSKQNMSSLDRFVFSNGADVSSEYIIKQKLDNVNSFMTGGQMENIVACYTIAVKNIQDFQNISKAAMDYYTIFDIAGADDNTKIEFAKTIDREVEIDTTLVRAVSKAEAITEYYGMYGGFLFIGLFLGILFMMATVLIIYYKQISEGYDDKERFEIMQKVGMSHAEIKKTIRSQVVMVFFLPLGVTAIHIAVSFRIIKKMLLILGLANGGLFLACTVAAMLMFSIVYGIVFAITAKAYYRIVSVMN